MQTCSAADIVTSNAAVLEEFFAGIASGDYYDGTSYQLYLDRHDASLSIHHEASDQSWLQRDDGSLIQIMQVSGYSDIPMDERYTEDCDLNDFEYAEWLGMIEAKISEALK